MPADPTGVSRTGHPSADTWRLRPERRGGSGWNSTRRTVSEARSLVRLLLDLVQDVLARYGLLAGSQFAAAIAYRALFSLVPLATFVATVLAEVLTASSVDQAKLVSSIAEQLDLSAAGATRLDALIDSCRRRGASPG